MCTTRRRTLASASTNQGYEKDDLIAGGGRPGSLRRTGQALRRFEAHRLLHH